MLRMMPDDFYDGGGGTASEWLKFIDENAKKWIVERFCKNLLQKETVVNRSWSSKGIPTRVTKTMDTTLSFAKIRSGILQAW